MANTIPTPYMNLPNPVPGTDPGPDYANNLAACNVIVDQHNHSAGSGQQIGPSGININADLPFNSNNATLLRTTRFSPQNSPIPNTGADVGELYVSGNELYYNDATGGNQVQITSNGLVNATSSGIASGTNSAAFSSNVLVVKASSISGADVEMKSAVLTNSGNLTNTLTLQAPTLSGSIMETLPPIPSAQSFMTIDTDGNMSGYASISQGIQRTNLVSVGQQISLSSGLFTTSSTSLVNVTNLTVTITTSGRPVILFCQSAGSALAYSTSINVTNTGGSPQNCTISFFMNGGGNPIYLKLETPQLASGDIFSFPPSSIFLIDQPSAGTTTYQLQAATTASSSLAINRLSLVAYEL